MNSKIETKKKLVHKQITRALLCPKKRVFSILAKQITGEVKCYKMLQFENVNPNRHVTTNDPENTVRVSAKKRLKSKIFADAGTIAQTPARNNLITLRTSKKQLTEH